MKNSIIVFMILDDILGEKLDGEVLSEKEFVEIYGRKCADEFIDAFLENTAEKQYEGIDDWRNGVHAIVKRLSFAEMRKMAGFTQKTFAEYLWIPKRTIENWEMNTECPSYLQYLIFEKLKNDGKKV